MQLILVGDNAMVLCDSAMYDGDGGMTLKQAVRLGVRRDPASPKKYEFGLFQFIPVFNPDLDEVKIDITVPLSDVTYIDTPLEIIFGEKNLLKIKNDYANYGNKIKPAGLLIPG